MYTNFEAAQNSWRSAIETSRISTVPSGISIGVRYIYAVPFFMHRHAGASFESTISLC